LSFTEISKICKPIGIQPLGFPATKYDYLLPLWFCEEKSKGECVMVNNLNMVLKEIEVLRKRMHELYLQKRVLKNQNLVRTSKIRTKNVENS